MQTEVVEKAIKDHVYAKIRDAVLNDKIPADANIYTSPELKSFSKNLLDSSADLIKKYAEDETICGFRNKIAAFLKGLLGVILSIPTALLF